MRRPTRAPLFGLILFLAVGCGDDGGSTPDAGQALDQCLSAQDRAIIEPWRAYRVADGGVADAGVVDGGVADGGMMDGGMTDGGAIDGGVDELILPGRVVGGCVSSGRDPMDAFNCYELLLNDGFEAGRPCVNECLDESELSTLTQGCRDCFIDWIFCGSATCVVACIGTDSRACEDCLFDACGDSLDLCVGY